MIEYLRMALAALVAYGGGLMVWDLWRYWAKVYSPVPGSTFKPESRLGLRPEEWRKRFGHTRSADADLFDRPGKG